MKLQISSRLAVFALLELSANPDRQYSVADIGKKYGVSSHHLAKIMHTLGRAGLVRSARGAGGGYQISANVRRTTLLDIIELFEQLESSGGNSESGEGTEQGQALAEGWGEIEHITRATLGSITLATMLKLVERHRDDASSTHRKRGPASRA